MFNNVRQQTNFRNIFDFIFDRNFENKIQFDRVDHKPEWDSPWTLSWCCQCFTDWKLLSEIVLRFFGHINIVLFFTGHEYLSNILNYSNKLKKNHSVHKRKLNLNEWFCSDFIRIKFNSSHEPLMKSFGNNSVKTPNKTKFCSWSHGKFTYWTSQASIDCQLNF